MDNELISIINELYNKNRKKEAIFLEKLSSNKEDNIREAQLEDTPFIPSRSKLLGYEPQTKKEKDWLRRKLPMTEQMKFKVLEDPRFSGELERLGGEKALYGYPYRDPYAISRTSDPEEIVERIKKYGWPPHGLTGPHGERVLDVDPKHRILDVGPRGGKTYEEKFDFGEGANIGVYDEGEYRYGPQEEFDPELVNLIQETWGKGQEQYGSNVSSAIDRFNKRLTNWNTKVFPMLSANFLTTLNTVVTGNSENNNVLNVKEDSESLSAIILRRINNIINIKNETIRRLLESGDYVTLQANKFIEFINDLNSQKDYPSELWFNKLMLVYGKDPRKGMDPYTMDTIYDNPLDIKYPSSFVDNITKVYNEYKKQSAERKPYQRKELTWEDILSRKFSPITFSPEETAEQRKMIEDVDIWKGFGSFKEENIFSPSIQSQADAIIYSYNIEIKHLEELLKDLQILINIKEELPSYKLSDLQENSDIINEMVFAVINFAKDLEGHYKQSEITTSEGKLSGSYSVGSETKLEIYIKCLYIIQAFEAWIKEVQNRSLSETELYLND